MIRAWGLGVTFVLTTFLTGCGIVVTDESTSAPVQIGAPALVEAFPQVEALVPATTRSLAVPRARRLARQAALGIRIPACDDDSTGRGFAVGAHTLIAHRDVIEGGGFIRVWAGRRSRAVGAASAYRVGDLGVARVARTLPRRLPVATKVASGTPVVAVTERNGKLRMLPGVVVDSVAGAPYGARTKLLRVTSLVREGDVGPVLDAGGRLVAVVFAVDETTTLGLAVPVSALRGRSATRVGEALEACD